jgi:hypothetical protein
MHLWKKEERRMDPLAVPVCIPHAPCRIWFDLDGGGVWRFRADLHGRHAMTPAQVATLEAAGWTCHVLDAATACAWHPSLTVGACIEQLRALFKMKKD